LDGVIAKRLDGPYVPGKREMVKVKHARDADCVAIGYRIHKSGEGVGSILLGLYRADGELHMVGGAASFTAKDRLKLLADLEPLRKADDLVYDGEPSRWNSAADKRWIPVRPEKVAEVAYDQMEGNNVHGKRFRHTVRFVRWRPDRDPTSCTFDQLEVPLNYDLYDVLES
jgi:ATP-dependent DNA ligase